MATEDKTDADQVFTHFNEAGEARMVDVGSKPESKRQAVASATVTLSSAAFDLVKNGQVGKGDVLGVARIAGIMAAKKVDDFIPLAHPLLIDKVDIDFKMQESDSSIGVEAKVNVNGRTGVEMEALTAVSVAALTIYDMCKAVDKGIIISNIMLLRKTGGKSSSLLMLKG